MADEEPLLQPVLAHLYGASVGRILATLANANAGERVVILGAPHDGPAGWDTGSVGDQSDPAMPTPESVADPLPIIDFVQLSDSTSLTDALGTSWDIAVGIPPIGHRRREAQHEFLDSLADSARPGGRAVLLLPLVQLPGSDPGVRGHLLLRGRVHTLAFPQRPPISRTSDVRIDPAMRFAVVRWEPGEPAGTTTVVRPRLREEPERAFTVELSADDRWSPAALDPELAKTIARWAEETRARPLEELAEFVTDPWVTGDAATVLHPLQLTKTGLQLEDVPPRASRADEGKLVAVAAGDLVGRRIGGPNWTVATNQDLGSGLVAPVRSITVLRPHRVDPTYLAAFLNSDAAARQLEREASGSPVQVAEGKALRQLLVPTAPVQGSAIRDHDAIREFRGLSTDLAESLEARYRSAFDEPEATLVRAALADASGDAAMATELLRRVTDPLHRARQFLPHPLARTLRVYLNHMRSQSHIDVYQDLLRFGETAIILLGAVGLAYTSQRGAVDEEWRTAFTRRGVPLGTWLRVANTGAETARRDGESLGGLADALATKSPLNTVLNQFLQSRNDDSHGAGPRSAYEYRQATLELEESLRAAIEELAALARSDWFVVENLAWKADPGSFAVEGRSLKGDHPDFAHWVETRTAPLESGVIHVRLETLDLPLAGFCILRSCALCLHEELYYPDRLRGSMVRLRSLDRGHQTEMPLDEARLPTRAINSVA